MHDDSVDIAPAADLAAETPVVFERSASSGARSFPWLALLFAAIAGVVGSGIGAVALGLWYQAEHSAERAAFDALADTFFTYMLCTGAIAGLVIRLGIAIFDRSPVLAAASFGALVGLGPGAVAARQFGMQPLPFVGSTGIVIATVPMVAILSFVAARSDGRRRNTLLPIVATIVVCALLGGLAALIASQIEMPSLLSVLRLYLFIGIERVGAILGAFVGVALGLAVGLTVRAHRMLLARFSAKPKPAVLR